MRQSFVKQSLLASAVFVLTGVPAAAQTNSDVPDDTLPGRAVYENFCQACHENAADERAIPFDQLVNLPRQQIEAALGENGLMAPMAASLTANETSDLIDYLVSGQAAEQDQSAWTDAFMCAADNRTVDLTGPETVSYTHLTLPTISSV